MRKILLTGLFLIVFPAMIFADTAIEPRSTEEQKLQVIDEAPSRVVGAAAAFKAETGGWLSYRYSHYHNSDNDNSTVDALNRSVWSDARVWGRLSYQTPEMAKKNRRNFVYVRLKDLYITRAGDAPGERFDNRGPLLDYAYAAFDWKPWKVEAGRRYFNIGRGIVFSGVFDGVQLNYQKPGWNFGSFVAKTRPRDNNIDTSVPGYDKNSRRYFAGTGVGYAGIPGHQLYSYAVVERDHSREVPDDPFQSYIYDAEYFALGSKGEWGKRWPYWMEVVRESGHSREYGTSAVSNVRAWALDAEQRFLTLWPSDLLFSAEYAMGTGDRDRMDVVNTINGNLTGRDRSFVHFGYIPTGSVVAPFLSNLRMLRVGFEVFPFAGIRVLEQMRLSVDHFWFWKDRPEGAAYDLDATETARGLGRELDVRLDWNITRRVILSAEWGCFMPGAAYAPATRSHDELSSVSLSYIF